MNEKINLPPPASTIIDFIRNISVRTNNEENYQKSKSFHQQNNPTKICAGCFYQQEIGLSYLVKNQFQHVFEEDFVVQLLRFRNFSQPETAVYPPHTDVGKLLNLNYVIDTGGNNVQTIFYDKQEEGPNKLLGQIERYENLTPIKHFIANPGEWHAIDVKRFHSLDNIVDTRTILCLGFNSISFSDFKLKYNNLICQE
jgi:hypothetical protein